MRNILTTCPELVRKWIPLLFVFLAGCSTPKQPEIGNEIIHVRKEFKPTLGWMDGGTTQYEFYLEAYRAGYWDCIENYAGNIDYITTDVDWDKQCGWMSQVVGWQDGYAAAERDVRRNIKRFGKERTAKYLKELPDG